MIRGPFFTVLAALRMLSTTSTGGTRNSFALFGRGDVFPTIFPPEMVKYMIFVLPPTPNASAEKPCLMLRTMKEHPLPSPDAFEAFFSWKTTPVLGLRHRKNFP